MSKELDPLDHPLAVSKKEKKVTSENIRPYLNHFLTKKEIEYLSDSGEIKKEDLKDKSIIERLMGTLVAKSYGLTKRGDLAAIKYLIELLGGSAEVPAGKDSKDGAPRSTVVNIKMEPSKNISIEEIKLEDGDFKELDKPSD